MRALTEKFVAYSDQEWAAIRGVFAEADINADQIVIGEDNHENYIVVPPDLARWQLDLMATRSLRRALDDVARHCNRLRGKTLSLTPKRRAERLKKVITACESAPHVMEYDDDAHHALTVLVNRMQEQHDKFAALGRMNQNARKIWRDAFWLDLLELWKAVTRKKKKTPRKVVVNFLLLCSMPVFSTKAKAIEYFLDKQSKTKA